MPERTDLEELARRYLDLWQDQVSALAADGDFADMMARMTAALGPAAAAPWAVWPAMLGLGTGAQAGPGGRPGEASGDGEAATASQRGPGPGGVPAATPGATAAAAPPGGGGHDLDELARRLATLEERIAALESGARRPGRSPRRKPAKSRS